MSQHQSALQTPKIKARRGDGWSAFDNEPPRAEKRYFDPVNNVTVVKLYSGDCYVAEGSGEVLMTILGSCVAACIRDPISKVGGMNHFLLPEANSGGHKNDSDAARYGAFAMEELINDILKRGGHKDRLEVKIFGGANVINNSSMIGDKNVTFVTRFLRDEGLPVAKADVGGTHPRRINYYPDTGQVMLRRLMRRDDESIVKKQEQKLAQQLQKRPIEGSIELFE